MALRKKAEKETAMKASKKEKADKKTVTTEEKEVFYQVIRSPLITEKSTSASEQSKVVFEVAGNATKPQIKEAIEALFGVKVTSVNTLNIKGKKKVFRGRLGERSGYKKAVVSLAKNEKIDVMAGV